MIKRTIYFGNPAYLSKKNEQLVIKYPVEEGEDEQKSSSIPIEDIGLIILDNQQITITQGLLESWLENNTAVISCSSNHLPSGMFFPLSVNQIQSQRFQAQIEASEPLKKQLWQQTISAKIKNQAAVLRKVKKPFNNMLKWSKDVRSGDPDNYEGRAAAYYWKNVFPPELEFIRDRNGLPPNNLLNYGYAILRAIVARSLCGSGLLPTLGIHHHNKYNAYCLADDIMEPYRPYVDMIVIELIRDGEVFDELNTSLKKQLLSIPVIDVIIDKESSPLMIAVQRTTASLAKCFEGNLRKILYPEITIGI